jgi:hypothetical protein
VVPYSRYKSTFHYFGGSHRRLKASIKVERENHYIYLTISSEVPGALAKDAMLLD